jgi:hypothetical protein
MSNEKGKREKGEGRRGTGERRIERHNTAFSLFPCPFSVISCVFFLLIFIIVATLNSGGYRYGASDQAFYVPAVLERLDPGLFPHDHDLIQVQARLTFFDETISMLARVIPLPLPSLFVVLYIVTLAMLALAAARVAGTLYRTRWAAVCLLAALTMKHEIARSGTNTLEWYFHPRQVAFACGVLGLAAFLRGRTAVAAALVCIGALEHPTTALWFAVWVGVAAVVADRHLRVPAAVICGVGAVLGGWALMAGPLAGRLSTMDPAWVATLPEKNYLFPLRWPMTAWLLNLGYVPVILAIFRRRRAAGLVTPRERGVLIGCLSLVVVFAVAVPLNAADVQLAVQTQPARIFWMLDFLATVYAVWMLAEGARPSERRARAVALAVIAVTIVRSGYVARAVSAQRELVSIDIPDTDWGRVMRWARGTARDTHWLADPAHAVKYGTSVRVAGQRDVFTEAIKDDAIGMYDRVVAMRTRDRLLAVGDFASLTPDRARQLASEYDLDYLVTEASMNLPLAFESGRLRVYRITDH